MCDIVSHFITPILPERKRGLRVEMFALRAGVCERVRLFLGARMFGGVCVRMHMRLYCACKRAEHVNVWVYFLWLQL